MASSLFELADPTPPANSWPAIRCGTLPISLAAQKTMEWFGGIDGTPWRAQQHPLAPSRRRHVDGAPASRDLRQRNWSVGLRSSTGARRQRQQRAIGYALRLQAGGRLCPER